MTCWLWKSHKAFKIIGQEDVWTATRENLVPKKTTIQKLPCLIFVWINVNFFFRCPKNHTMDLFCGIFKKSSLSSQENFFWKAQKRKMLSMNFELHLKNSLNLSFSLLPTTKNSLLLNHPIYAHIHAHFFSFSLPIFSLSHLILEVQKLKKGRKNFLSGSVK